MMLRLMVWLDIHLSSLLGYWFLMCAQCTWSRSFHQHYHGPKPLLKPVLQQNNLEDNLVHSRDHPSRGIRESVSVFPPLMIVVEGICPITKRDCAYPVL